jgi:hypothetical protein
MNILVIQTLLALLAGFWRVVDGRGKKWFPFDTILRNGVTFGLALIISYLALGLTPTAGVFAVLATASIVVGKTNWDSYAHMLVRYTAPAAIAVGTSTVIGQADLTYGIWYIALCALPGVVYPSMQRWGQKLGDWGVYISEFVVGATVLGGISVF